MGFTVNLREDKGGGIYTLLFAHRAQFQLFYGIYTVHLAHQSPFTQPSSTLPHTISSIFFCAVKRLGWYIVDWLNFRRILIGTF